MLLLNARDLTDLQWAALDALIPEPPRRKDGRGRKMSLKALRRAIYSVGARRCLQESTAPTLSRVLRLSWEVSKILSEVIH